jgi:hypothetical protein
VRAQFETLCFRDIVHVVLIIQVCAALEEKTNSFKVSRVHQSCSVTDNGN